MSILLFTTSPLISLLITLLIIAVVIYVVKLILDMIPMPYPIKTIVYIIFAIAVIYYLLQRFNIHI